MNEQYAIQVACQEVAPAESFSANAYWDVNGYAIGFGFHNYADGSAVQQGDTMTLDDANALLVTTVTGFWQAIKPCITANINENQAAALIDLAYNCGNGLVCKSTVLQLINAGADEATISAQWEQTCTTANGTYLSVLYNRRVDEVDMFFSTLSQNVTSYVQQNPIQILIGGAVLVTLTGYLIYRVTRKKTA